MNDIEQMQLNIFDYSPLAYCVIEMVLDDNGQPVDGIFGEGDRYLHIYVMPTGKRGYCVWLIRDIRERYVLDKLCEDLPPYIILN